MTTETKLRGGIALSLLCLIMMTFEYFEKDRVYQELKVSSSKQIDSLRDELNVQHMINGELSYNWEILREINPILADSIDNQTE
jgi:hypothetical protein